MIIKELEAQRQIDSILIICPKPLVAEEKWNREMERFDEHFVSVDKQSLLRIMDQNNRDSQWPIHSKKLVIPYSIMDEQLYEGKDDTIVAHTSLMQLDPPPHFDLVIIDEAHHIRNGSMEKEKAFNYKCVRYFCEHSDAVVMLTATPIQNTRWQHYANLLLAIAAKAKAARRVNAALVEPADSEMKYFCRAFLLQLGLGGAEHRDMRSLLLNHLHGYAAFRTTEKMDAHRQKYADLRRQLRESDSEAQSEVTEHEKA